MSGADTEGHLVVVGASAGGVEALSVLVAGLRPDFPAPIVIAQHLDPSRQSHLKTILERKSTVPVVEVEDEMPLEPARVYVVPSNRHVTVHDGHVRLEKDPDGRPRPSVDRLLSTAAQAYGDRLVAVILTGQGSDGAAGAVDVRGAGGVVVVQDPHTAAFPSMPLALPPTAVDHTAELAAIPALLHDLVTGATLARETESDGSVLGDILALLGRQANIDFRPYKPATIRRRIGRRMAVTHALTLAQYREYLGAHPEEVGELVKAILIKVTEFFRDPDAFEVLGKEVLPAVIASARERGRTLRLWSAGCATGEEAYSIAIAAAEALGSELPEWQIKVFGTDLDETAIAFARRGLYPDTALRQLGPELRAKYFENDDHGIRVAKPLRQILIFGQQDLSRGVPFPRIDLVVCRNLLIYFKPELQALVLDLFSYSLGHTHGYLFLGKAETARPSNASFDLVNKKWKVYRCLSGPVTVPAGAPAPPPPDRRQRPLPRAGPRPAAPSATEAPSDQLLVLRRTIEIVLRQVPVGIVLLDRTYRIVSLNGTARRLLGIRDLRADGLDFLHASRGLPYADVRNAIDRVLHEQSVVELAEVAVQGGAETRFLSLSLAPNHVEASGRDLVIVTILDVTDAVVVHRTLHDLQTEQRQLMDELVATNKRLAETNRELQNANEELQSANEEMMLAQEELQATNEELQATNEEMETNNEELQATNEELETTNEELTARSADLQEVTRVLDGERTRLAQILEHAPLHLLVLRGPGLVVETVTPADGPLFGGRSAVGRRLEEIAKDPAAEQVLRAARDVLRDGRPWASAPLTSAVVEGGRPVERAFLYRAVPLHDPAGNVDGIAVFAQAEG